VISVTDLPFLIERCDLLPLVTQLPASSTQLILHVLNRDKSVLSSRVQLSASLILILIALLMLLELAPGFFKGDLSLLKLHVFLFEESFARLQLGRSIVVGLRCLFVGLLCVFARCGESSDLFFYGLLFRFLGDAFSVDAGELPEAAGPRVAARHPCQ